MNWSYIAGFFDGEGYVYANGKIVLTMTQVNREVLEQIMAFTGVGHITTDNQRGNKRWTENWKASYTYRISKQADIADFLRKVYSDLVVKRSAADRALKEYESKERISRDKVARIKEQLDLISQKRRSGATWDAIATEFGCSGDTLRHKYNYYTR